MRQLHWWLHLSHSQELENLWLYMMYCLAVVSSCEISQYLIAEHETREDPEVTRSAREDPKVKKSADLDQPLMILHSNTTADYKIFASICTNLNRPLHIASGQHYLQRIDDKLKKFGSIRTFFDNLKQQSIASGHAQRNESFNDDLTTTRRWLDDGAMMVQWWFDGQRDSGLFTRIQWRATSASQYVLACLSTGFKICSWMFSAILNVQLPIFRRSKANINEIQY